MTRASTVTDPAPPPPTDTADRFEASEADAGARLDKWLTEQVPGLTRTRVKALIEGGALTRDGAPFDDPSWRLRAGERFVLAVPPVADPVPKGEAIPLDIRYEDEHLIVLMKPAGLVVHPAAGNWSGTLVNALIAHCGPGLTGVGGVARPGIVHRLDKDTSGLIVAAKTEAAHRGLSAAFAARDVDRAYDAVCVGAPRPAAGTVDAPLARKPGARKQMAVVRDGDTRPDARRAVTHYRAVTVYGRGLAKLPGDALATRLDCKLETGRTHQIRAHLAHIGHPLIGDPLYGRGPGLAGLRPGTPAADAALAALGRFRRQALHARRLGFAHPVDGAPLVFDAEPPADYLALCAALQGLTEAREQP